MVEFIIGLVIGFLVGLFWDDIRGRYDPGLLVGANDSKHHRYHPKHKEIPGSVPDVDIYQFNLGAL